MSAFERERTSFLMVECRRAPGLGRMTTVAPLIPGRDKLTRMNILVAGCTLCAQFVEHDRRPALFRFFMTIPTLDARMSPEERK